MPYAIRLGRIGRARLLGSSSLFNQAGRAGPRRLVILSVVAISFVGVVGALTFSGRHKPALSSDTRMNQVDALPGGLHSSPEQDALAYNANSAAADAAQRRGGSYTPPIGASASLLGPTPMAELPDSDAATAAPQQPRFIGAPKRVFPAVVVIPPAPTVDPTPAVAPAAAPPIVQVAQPLNDAQQEQYNQQVKNLFSEWDGRAPKTDIILEVPEAGQNVSAADGKDDPPVPEARRTAQSDRNADADVGQVLIPAGRGIYAHPVLALSSDQQSPAVFQADSGPIAGDRMIGSFSRENNRLVVRISTIVHQGQEIGASGLVIAPDTMEASVASGVNQHLLTRFLLPAAAAFVQGLGQAIATTSNTTAVLSPFGGATTSTRLNLDQQLGVAAGTAASNIGSTLNAAAPKGPTISLDSNVSVGVMFLSNVMYHPDVR